MPSHNLPPACLDLGPELAGHPHRMTGVGSQLIGAFGEADHVGQRVFPDTQEHLVEHLGSRHRGGREAAHEEQ